MPGFVVDASRDSVQRVVARRDRLHLEEGRARGAAADFFLGGFALWNLDNIYCSKLKAWRHELGLPWGILLEGHGWWHLMTGTGAYFYLVWGIWLRYHLKGMQDEVKLIWPRLMTSIPEVVRVKNASNGSAKKNI